MSTATMGCHSTCRGSSSASRPSWLQAALSDLEQRFQSLSLRSSGEDSGDTDSFADRAENYYQKRPQLLSLVHDLYHRYLSLADRYAQALLKSHHNSQQQQKQPHHSRSQSQISLVPSDLDDSATDLSSDAESSLSFQPPRPVAAPPETVLVELISRSIENELLRHEVEILGRETAERGRKAALQGSLLEVLESERAVLLGENARLAGRAAEAEAGAAEAGAMRRRAEELARLVVRVREEHRACALGRRIEALQAQVYALERRNRECRDATARREAERAEALRAARSELERVRAENRRLRAALGEVRRGRRRGAWRTVRKAVGACAGGRGGGAAAEDDEGAAVTGCAGMAL